MGKKLTTFTYTFRPKKEAFAVYSESDYSLEFFKRETVPKPGELSPTGKVISEVYTGFETESYTGDWQTATITAPWNDFKIQVESVSFEDPIKPQNTAYWFFHFEHCVSFNLKKLDTSDVADMLMMFYSCFNIQTLDLSAFNTENVRNMGSMFHACVKLEYLNISSFNTKNLKGADYMFAKCYMLRELDISNFDMTALSYNMAMFVHNNNMGKTGLHSCSKIKVSDSFKPSPEGFPTPSPDKIPGADGYWYNEKGEKFLPTEIPENTADTYYAVKPDLTAYAVYSEDDNSLEFFKRATVPQVGDKSPTGKSVSEVYTGFETNHYWVHDWANSVTTLPWDGIKRIIKTVSVQDSINPASTCSWFFSFTECTSFDLRKLDTENVSNMSVMFLACSKIKTLDLSSFNTSNVSNMRDMFHGCYNLTSINISSFHTSNVKDTFRMFCKCLSLKNLNLSTFDMSNVTYGEEMFEQCSSLQQVIVGNKFSFPVNGCLPVPSPDYSSGADGNWYNSKGEGFTPDAIPANTADTYYAALSLFPGQSKLLKAPIIDDKAETLEKTEDMEQLTESQEDTIQAEEYQEDAAQTKEAQNTEDQKEIQIEEESNTEENVPAEEAAETIEELIFDENSE